MIGNRKILVNAVAACCLLLLAARPALADLLDDITQARKIRISTDLAIPPSAMMDSSMKPTGSDVEVAQLLAKDWGLELEFIQTTGATRIPNVLTGKADIIISTLSVTPDRAKVIDFTKRYAQGLESSSGLPNLTEALMARGYTSDDVQKIMGGNFLRVFSEVAKKRASSIT